MGNPHLPMSFKVGVGWRRLLASRQPIKFRAVYQFQGILDRVNMPHNVDYFHTESHGEAVLEAQNEEVAP